MRSQFSNYKRCILDKKVLMRVVCRWRTVLLANIWPAWTRTLCFKGKYFHFQYILLLLSTLPTGIDKNHWCPLVPGSPALPLPKAPSPWGSLSSSDIAAFHGNGSHSVFHFWERKIVDLLPYLSIAAVKIIYSTRLQQNIFCSREHHEIISPRITSFFESLGDLCFSPEEKYSSTTAYLFGQTQNGFKQAECDSLF